MPRHASGLLSWYDPIVPSLGWVSSSPFSTLSHTKKIFRLVLSFLLMVPYDFPFIVLCDCYWYFEVFVMVFPMASQLQGFYNLRFSFLFFCCLFEPLNWIFKSSCWWFIGRQHTILSHMRLPSSNNSALLHFLNDSPLISIQHVRMFYIFASLIFVDIFYGFIHYPMGCRIAT